MVAGVLFQNWTSIEASKCFIKLVTDIEPYEPGSFYKRELPCILSLLEDISDDLEVIVVDGYVTLGQEHRKGLGMHLYESLDKKISVIGVAKKAFKDTPSECEVYRGASLKPLYVTSVGLCLEKSISYITSMSGKHRIPTLLKKADQLCRGVNA